MFVRNKEDVRVVNWGNGQSFRFLMESDGMGFTVAHTVVTAGTASALQYRRHLEACYCISGKGEVITTDGVSHPIEAGTLYALNDHDAHTLCASDGEDMHLISVFNPPLTGGERHQLSSTGYSQY